MSKVKIKQKYLVCCLIYTICLFAVSITMYKKIKIHYELEINKLNIEYQSVVEKSGVNNEECENKRVFLTPQNSKEWELLDYESPEDKMEYEWFNGIYTEFGWCRKDSELLSNMNNYNNPIDSVYMIYLNGRAVSCEAAKRELDYSYADAWKKEFYNVSNLLYESLKIEADKERFVSYIKTIRKIIEKEQDLIISYEIEATNTVEEDIENKTVYGIGTNSMIAKEEGELYRVYTLKLIKLFESKCNIEYEYITNEITIKEGLETVVPNKFN